jgi:hypothetical protein
MARGREEARQENKEKEESAVVGQHGRRASTTEGQEGGHRGRAERQKTWRGDRSSGGQTG